MLIFYLLHSWLFCLQFGYFGMDPIVYCFTCALLKAESQANVQNTTYTPHSSETPPTISDSPFPDIATISVDANEVLNLLNELDISKAPGPDKIPAHFLSCAALKQLPF